VSDPWGFQVHLTTPVYSRALAELRRRAIKQAYMHEGEDD
jgi:hypothetical protein